MNLFLIVLLILPEKQILKRLNFIFLLLFPKHLYFFNFRKKTGYCITTGQNITQQMWFINQKILQNNACLMVIFIAGKNSIRMLALMNR